MQKYLYVLRITPQGQTIPSIETVIYAATDDEAEMKACRYIPLDFTGQIFFAPVARDYRVGVDVFPAYIEV